MLKSRFLSRTWLQPLPIQRNILYASGPTLCARALHAGVTAMASEPAPRKKLHGRAFYESIGAPKLILAPMVDQSEFAWRLLTRSFLSKSEQSNLVAYSPMLHARLFAATPNYRATAFEPLRQGLPAEAPHELPPPPDEKEWHLDGNPAHDRPLFVQFCANDPEELLTAARHVQPFCDAVDLNLGCPQGIAKKGHYGAFLQEQPDLIARMIRKLHEKLAIPVTAKMRILDTKEATLAYAKTILEAGASILTVHGRRREQKGHLTGVADWEYIRYLRQNLPKETVIFANGNILQHGDIAACLEATGADGVMSAEGNLYDPSIFSNPPPADTHPRGYWRGKNGLGGWRMDEVLRRYLDIIHRFVLGNEPPARRPLWIPGEEWVDYEEPEEDGPPKKKPKCGKKALQSPNLGAMQPHLFHMLRALVSKQTHIRDMLAQARKGEIESYEKVLQQVEKATKEGMEEYERNPDMMKDMAVDSRQKLKMEDLEESSVATVARCQRPWFVCQPYVRPLPKEALKKGAISLSKKDKERLAKIEEEEKLKESAGVAAQGRVEQVRTSGSGHGKEVPGSQKTDDEETQVEIPKEGVVCG